MDNTTPSHPGAAPAPDPVVPGRPAPVPQHTSSPVPNGPSSVSASAVGPRMLSGVRNGV